MRSFSRKWRTTRLYANRICVLGITQFFNSIADNLSKGLKVKTPIGEFRPTIRGSLESLDEDFRPFASTNNHRLKISVSPDPKLVADVVKNIRTEKIMENAVRQPTVFSIENRSNPVDEGFHARDVLILRGVNLKFDPEAEDEGVFWTNGDGGPIRTANFSLNTSSQIHCQIPDLPPGDYTLEIASRLGNHDLRTAAVEDTIPVS